MLADFHLYDSINERPFCDAWCRCCSRHNLQSARIDALLVSSPRFLLCAPSLFGFSSAFKIIRIFYQEAAPGVIRISLVMTQKLRMSEDLRSVLVAERPKRLVRKLVPSMECAMRDSIGPFIRLSLSPYKSQQGASILCSSQALAGLVRSGIPNRCHVTVHFSVHGFWMLGCKATSVSP